MHRIMLISLYIWFGVCVRSEIDMVEKREYCAKFFFFWSNILQNAPIFCAYNV